MNDTTKQCEGIPGRNGGTLRPWPKGVSGNPRGRPKLGLTIIEHYNTIGDAMERGAITVADVEEMAKSDPNGNRRIAAASYMRMLNTGYFNATPLAANDLDRVMDRTAGKPTQKVEVSQSEPSPGEVLVQISGILSRRPDLARRVTGILPHEIIADIAAQSASEKLPEA